LFISVDTVLGSFYNAAAEYHRVSQNYAAAMQFCQSALALAVSTGSPKRQSQALQVSAWVKIDSGDFSGSKDDASESQRAAKITGNLYVEAGGLRIEAICWQYFGNYSHCLSLIHRATHLMDLCGMFGCAMHNAIRVIQAEVHRCKSEYAEARNIQIHILQDCSADQSPYLHALALLNIAQIDVETGASEHEIQGNLGTALTLFQERLKYSTGVNFCDTIRAALNIQQGNSSAARRCFQKCLQTAWGKDVEVVSHRLEKLGAFHQWGPVDQGSFPCTVSFLVHSIKHKQMLELHKALQFLGDVFQAQGDQTTAVSLFTVALNGFNHMDVHRSRAECMVRLGAISKLNGDELKAAALWQTARPLFEQSLQGKQLAALDTKLAGIHHNELKEV
jgi:tetratricopeptide (TPR) repeat protein